MLTVHLSETADEEVRERTSTPSEPSPEEVASLKALVTDLLRRRS